MTIVNTYGNDSRSQQVLFAAHGLGAGPHNISGQDDH